jgi:hypothetical protein
MEEFADSTAGMSRQLQSVGTSIGLAIGGFLVAIVFVFLGVGVLRGVGIGLQEQPIAATALSIVLQGAGFGAAVAIYLSLTDNWDLIRVRLPTRRDLVWTGLGIVAIVLAYLGISVVISTLGITSAENSIVEQGRQNPGLVPLLIPLTILVVAPSEELLFRGAIQGVLRTSYSKLPGVVIASALFAVAHTFALIGSGQQMLVYISVTFALGLVLGYLYERTENIVVPVVVHGVYNSILFTILYLQVSGTV